MPKEKRTRRTAEDTARERRAEELARHEALIASMAGDPDTQELCRMAFAFKDHPEWQSVAFPKLIETMIDIYHRQVARERAAKGYPDNVVLAVNRLTIAFADKSDLITSVYRFLGELDDVGTLEEWRSRHEAHCGKQPNIG